MIFYNVYSFDFKRVDFAIKIESSHSLVYPMGMPINPFRLSFKLNECFPISQPYFAFFDYSANVVGVVSLTERKVIWSKSIKITNGGFIGVDRGSEMVLIQNREELWTCSPLSGDILRKENVSGKIHLFESGCLVVSDRKEFLVKYGAKEIKGEYKQNIGFAKFLNGSIVVSEEQCALFIIDSLELRVIKKIAPPINSRFSMCHVSRDSRLILGVSYFDEPTKTHIWSSCDLGFGKFEQVVLNCAGKYIFIADGSVVAFACGEAFSTSNGNRIPF